MQTYDPGKPQPSLDKQPLRDWLTKNRLKGKEDVSLPEDIIATMAETYRKAYRTLTGEEFVE